MSILTPIAMPSAATVSAPAMMTACRVHSFGSPAVISLERVEMPVPGEGEVLIRVHAAGVGPWDGWIRAGRSVLPQPLPLTLGSDLSGVVAAVGPGVTAFQEGDAVFGVTNPRFVGAYAEYAVASAGMIARRPARLDDIDAASMPVIATTALEAVERAGSLAGRTVLIHGAAGCVGAYAVQLARRARARVMATVGGRDLDYVRGLGADVAVDYQTDRFEGRCSQRRCGAGLRRRRDAAALL